MAHATDDGIKKMARFLREGATMMDIACPLCNNPIFKLKNGEKACVVCERKVVLDTELIAPAEKEVKDNTVEHQPKKLASSKTITRSRDILDELKATCMKKIAFLVDELDHATSVEQMHGVNECILQIFSILDHVKFH